MSGERVSSSKSSVECPAFTVHNRRLFVDCWSIVCRTSQIVQKRRPLVKDLLTFNTELNDQTIQRSIIPQFLEPICSGSPLLFIISANLFLVNVGAFSVSMGFAQSN
ncbi:958_t:CDS:2 [Paraglomus occultum]|uniref:958_t:CDS:1 n=1 Tax=Paraglomus occultum TaxID=144539 RepID=A0A9N9H2T4_9GLOM|nr:958_t:CDS:2 [Paraglomus occultum]